MRKRYFESVATEISMPSSRSPRTIWWRVNPRLIASSISGESSAILGKSGRRSATSFRCSLASRSPISRHPDTWRQVFSSIGLNEEWIDGRNVIAYTSWKFTTDVRRWPCDDCNVGERTMQWTPHARRCILPPRLGSSGPIRGWSGHPSSMVQGLDTGFNALAFVGCHSAGGHGGNPLPHTMSGATFARVELNGAVASESLLFYESRSTRCEDGQRHRADVGVIALLRHPDVSHGRLQLTPVGMPP